VERSDAVTNLAAGTVTGWVERAEPADLAMLAMERRGGMPEHVAAVLVLDRGPAPLDATALRRVLAARARGVPRLHQRLVRAGLGQGRWGWVDEPSFDPLQHVRVRRCPPPGDEQALLDLAAAVVVEPLPRSRPLWAAVVVPGLHGERIGLVIVLHHAVADGVGGLALLSLLVDDAQGTPASPPSPRSSSPLYSGTAAGARERIRAWCLHLPGRLRAAWRELQGPVTVAGGLRAPAAAPCSLLAPTGPHRRLAVARAELAALRVAAHRHGGTVNDALLAAVSGALQSLLRRRGEMLGEFRVAVMVGGRVTASPGEPGNRAVPVVVSVPAVGEPDERLARLTGTVRVARAAVTGPPLLAVLEPLFRVAASAGLYRRYLRHQRRMHTLVSNVHGPDRSLAFGGAPVAAIVPVAVGETGNLSVTFVALSYAGTLTITVVCDPDAVPDLPVLVEALQRELDALIVMPAS
jgi:diacylglycerol O-acyltransferase / wax synthase